jgi:predicted GNAT family acetyltransferase
MPSEVVNDPPMNRYELLVDGAQVGATDYQVNDADRTITFIHTEVDPSRQEKGLGTELVRSALNLVRAETDYRVIAKCPFTKRFIQEHPDYQDLLTR